MNIERHLREKRIHDATLIQKVISIDNNIKEIVHHKIRNRNITILFIKINSLKMFIQIKWY